MKPQLEHFLSIWPSGIIADRDIYCIFGDYSNKAQKDLIERAIAWGWLQRVKRGLYVIGRPFRTENPSRFEVAQHIYGPSYISMESALSHHQMIPEAVYATVSVTAKRSMEFKSPLGLYLFHHIPPAYFFEGVDRIEDANNVYLMASPLKALGDYIYVNKKEYNTVREITSDLRIEREHLANQPITLLRSLEDHYPSRRVQQFYRRLHKELYQ